MGNWYTDSFIILHADHHTREDFEVGADADLEATRAAIEAVDPDVIQIHAKGNPGWTTYPSDVGFTPPKLQRDVLGLWKGIAQGLGKPFSVYYNLGRDGEIMKRRPEWNRVDSGGRLRDRMIAYAAEVREQYLWPQIEEIIDRYDPDGFWFDGSCFTVLTSYADSEIRRWRDGSDQAEPRTPRAPGYQAFKEMHREIYRELIRDTARRIREKKPSCLVAVNLAYTNLMPERPTDDVDYLTVDIADRVDRVAPVAAMMDSQKKPFDLMVAVWYSDARFIGDVERSLYPKPAEQLMQEAAIIISRGGRFSAWDTPTPGSGLVDERVRRLAEVTPWIRERAPWCERSKNLPFASIFYSDLTHYADTADSESCFLNRWPTLGVECDILDSRHIPYEILPAWRLAEDDVAGSFLIVEDPHILRDEEVAALKRYADTGGRILLTGDALPAGGSVLRDLAGVRFCATAATPVAIAVDGADPTALAASRFFDVEVGDADVVVRGRHEGTEVPLCVRRGSVYYCPIALHAELAERGYRAFPDAGGEHVHTDDETTAVAELWDIIVSEILDERPIETDAPEHVHMTVREQPDRDRVVVHLVNRHSGRRTAGTIFPCIEEIQPVRPFRLAVRVGFKPSSVSLAPDVAPLSGYRYENGVVSLDVPGFDMHSLVVIQR